MRVCGVEFSRDTIQRIKQTLEETPLISRRALARCVCEWLDWRAANGKCKEMVCRKALGMLERQGVIGLRAAEQPCTGERAVWEKRSGWVEPADVACDLSELGDLDIELVGSRYRKAAGVWRALLERHHDLGSGPLCGAQIRYLVRSSTYGYLGGLSFSSAAWALKARDASIGWTERARIRNLQRVVCNSRFLIVPTVQVPNLASHVLSQCARRLARDWLSRYGVEPVLLETFVNPKHFAGVCYRAANWRYVGKTSGRRQTGGPKDIYLYPLCADWQEILCSEGETRLGERARVADPLDWVEEEFGTVELYDPRLKRRLFTLVRDFFHQPLSPIPMACGCQAKTKAAYRFFRNKRIDMDTVLRAHVESTAERIKAHEVVLAVQDTTTLNYTAHPAMEGLGPIGTSRDTSVGLIVHDTMAFTVEGTPLGLVDVQCWARDPEDRGKKHRRKELPIEQKESMKWLKSYRAVAEVQRLSPQSRLISVGDRESDIYELFLEAAQDLKGPDLLVRCERSRNRKCGELYLWETMSTQPVAGFQVVRVPRQGSIVAREATLEVRYGHIELKAPHNKPYQSVEVWMVYAKEIDYGPEVKEPLDWMLLTTVAVSNFSEACERLAWYTKRWGIEVYHRTLKSGCRIEDRRLGEAHRLEACLAIDMVVAWRIHHLTKLGREVPDSPCTVFFAEAEWKALYIFINKSPTLPDKEPTLREAIRMTASLGGFLGRKGDREPGTTTIWRGLQRLEDITATYLVLLPHLKSGP